jgi:hypothetical protein
MMGMMDILAKSMTALANKVDQMKVQASYSEPPRKKLYLKLMLEAIRLTYEEVKEVTPHNWYVVRSG